MVLPILLVLVFGLMEISLYFWEWGLAQKAAQLGARRAVVSTPVAAGPGLDSLDSDTYWDGLPPGASCFPSADGTSICPRFSVTCDIGAGCRCPGGSCRFQFVASRLTPILAAMRTVMPGLNATNIEISYTTNDLGYVTRPVPVPVDVRVRLVGITYRPLLLTGILGPSLFVQAFADLPSESLLTR